MRKAVAFVILATAFVSAGCGGTSHDSLARETVDVFNEMSIAIETSSNAKEAKPKLEKVATRMKDLKARADKLGKPAPETEKQLEAKYKPEIEKAMTRYMTAMMTFAKKDPAGMLELQPIFKDLDKSK